MKKRINPNLLKLAEMTCNPDLKMPNLEESLEEQEISLDTSPKEGFIYVPSIGVHVAKQRSHTGLNWTDTHSQLHQEGLYMPTIPQFIAFVNYLKGDYQRLGVKEKQEAEQILDDILTVRNPWRAEWLDARFEEKGEELYVHYNHRTIKGELKSQSEKLEGCLMENKLPGIDLEYWLNNHTKQGLPKPDNLDGDLCYWGPRNNRVARFDAYSGRVNLLCDRNPDYSDDSLGVFGVCEANAMQ